MSGATQRNETPRPRALYDPLPPGELSIVLGKRRRVPSILAIECLETNRTLRCKAPPIPQLYPDGYKRLTPSPEEPKPKRRKRAELKSKPKRGRRLSSPRPPPLQDLSNVLICAPSRGSSSAQPARVAGSGLHSLDFSTLQRVLGHLVDFEDVWLTLACYRLLQPRRFLECMGQPEWRIFVARYFTDHMDRVCVESSEPSLDAGSCTHELFATPWLARMHPNSPWLYGRSQRGAAPPPRNATPCGSCGVSAMHGYTQPELAPVLLGSFYLPTIDMHTLLKRPSYDIVSRYVRALYEPEQVYPNRRAAIHRSWEYACLRENIDEPAALDSVSVCSACMDHCMHQETLDAAAVAQLSRDYSTHSSFSAKYQDEDGVPKCCAPDDGRYADRCALCLRRETATRLELLVTPKLFCALPVAFAERLFWENRVCGMSCVFSRKVLLPRIASLFGIVADAL